MLKFKLITGPTIEPFEFADLPQDQIRTDGDSEKSLIEQFIKAARKLAEDFQNRQLITATWELMLDQFPSGKILIKKNPVQEIVKISYYDENDQLQEIASEKYQLDQFSEPAILVPKNGEQWPSTFNRLNSVIIQFKAGYGDDATKIPDTTKQAMLMTIANFYDNRGDEGHRAIPKTVFNLLGWERITTFE